MQIKEYLNKSVSFCVGEVADIIDEAPQEVQEDLVNAIEYAGLSISGDDDDLELQINSYDSSVWTKWGRVEDFFLNDVESLIKWLEGSK